MRKIKKFTPIILFGLAALILTCEKVPDYCGKGSWYDPNFEFCFGSTKHPRCGGKDYNPLTQGCVDGAEVGCLCSNGDPVPFGTPCAGYALTTAATPTDGGRVTRTPSKDYYRAFDIVTLNAAANPGYVFIGWAGAENLDYTATSAEVIMDKNKPMVAMFRPLDAPGTLITTAFPENSGTITREPYAAVYDTSEKTQVAITAKPNTGYTFTGWSGASNSKNAAIKLTMNDSKTLVAMFKPKVYTLTASAIPLNGGAVFVNGTALSKPISQDFGTEIEAIAVAADGYYFAEWTGAAKGLGNPAKFSVADGDMEFAANFKQGAPPTPRDTSRQLFPVTIVLGETGASVMGGAYAAGAVVTVNAGRTVNGLAFKNWTSESDGVKFAKTDSAKTTFVMPANAVTVTANFGVGKYKVTISSAGTNPTGGGNYAEGDTVDITAGTPPAGRRFKNWAVTEGGGSGLTLANANNAVTSFIMPANEVTVTAAFELINTTGVTTYAVTISSTGTGATGGGNYPAGETVIISAGTPPTGRIFKNWTTASDSVTFANANNSTTSFTMPADAVTVTANFAAVNTVTVSTTGAGAAGGGGYMTGDTVTIYAGTPPTGRIFKNWTTASAGVTFANANSEITTFIMPSNAVTVTANFELQLTDTLSCGDHVCRSVTIGTQTWMAENLNYAVDSSWCRGEGGPVFNPSTNRFETLSKDEIQANCKTYGRLYQWASAMDIEAKYNSTKWNGSDVGHQGVCPAGWHLPSRAEWDALVTAAGGSSVAGTKLLPATKLS